MCQSTGILPIPPAVQYAGSHWSQVLCYCLGYFEKAKTSVKSLRMKVSIQEQINKQISPNSYKIYCLQCCGVVLTVDPVTLVPGALSLRNDCLVEHTEGGRRGTLRGGGLVAVHHVQGQQIGLLLRQIIHLVPVIKNYTVPSQAILQWLHTMCYISHSFSLKNVN